MVSIDLIVKRSCPWAVLAGLFLWVSCLTPRIPTGVEVNTRDVMMGQVGSHYRSLLDALALGPRTDDDWQRVAQDARCLQECGRLLAERRDPRQPIDETWQIATLTLREKSAGIVDAAHAGDLAAARARFAEMNRACSSCHRACDAAYRLPW